MFLLVEVEQRIVPARTRLYLNGDTFMVVNNDQIDLAAVYPSVAFQDPGPSPLEKEGGDRLA